MPWLLLLVTLLPLQNHHRGMNDRGATVMGFDQDKTTHHFYLYNDGGAIDIAVKATSNEKDRDAIRAHLSHIAMMFGDGNFDAPMLIHNSTSVPGTVVLKERKDALRYSYVETPGGGRVDIVSTDRLALAALHDLLRYQIVEHQTMDPTTVTKRQ
jgi:hypothetical protein